ncbi:hypothetical protein TPAR_03468 [Tolypocladium paradoxum]|uniref:Uncharacterized protein n=1 Tax=Tolypocladium paradoxum TaxID=94208 RepID=A0A2S4L1L9_9HYPO|nr:hypothetical protein TPAR_03468 [Tolypocladium paradoxum]
MTTAYIGVEDPGLDPRAARPRWNLVPGPPLRAAVRTLSAVRPHRLARKLVRPTGRRLRRRHLAGLLPQGRPPRAHTPSSHPEGVHGTVRESMRHHQVPGCAR